MAHLIDKDRVVKEIEKRKCQNILNEGAFEEDIDILSFLNTLKVKEVDLKNEIANLYESNYEDYLTYEEFAYIAKYFFELGHNEQKGK